MLYNEDVAPKIQAEIDISDQNDVVEESLAEWCPEMNAMKLEVGKKEFSDDIPKQLSAAEALNYTSEEVDFRPHLYDKAKDDWYLVDSGSQVTAWPPDPGDKEDPRLRLKAVNNSRMKCYGFKDIVVKIGRKEYRFKAIKSEVDSPVLGWDFMWKHKLDIVWNEFGDNCIRDKVAKITTVLPFKPVLFEKSQRQKNLCLVEVSKEPRIKQGDFPQSQANLIIMDQIAGV